MRSTTATIQGKHGNDGNSDDNDYRKREIRKLEKCKSNIDDEVVFIELITSPDIPKSAKLSDIDNKDSVRAS